MLIMIHFKYKCRTLFFFCRFRRADPGGEIRIIFILSHFRHLLLPFPEVYSFTVKYRLLDVTI